MNKAKEEIIFEEIKDSVSATLIKLLTHGKTKPLFDVKIVTQEILNYIKRSITTVSPDNRYEEYYRLTGKAVTIAEAWLKNYAGTIKHYEETQASIQEYISKTYGIRI